MIDVQTVAFLKSYIKETLAGAGALKGEPGKSAYETAVEKGFSGTEEEWLESMKIPPNMEGYVKSEELIALTTAEIKEIIDGGN